MSALAQQQQALLEALWAPRHADADALLEQHLAAPGDAARAVAARGLRAYRAQGRELAVRALAVACPVTADWLGEDNFPALAAQHWRARPPARGDLAQWGGDWASFLEGIDELVADQPLLPDMARLEWAVHQAAMAADAAADLPSLMLLGEADPAAFTLVLAPGTACIDSTGPLASVWLAAVSGGEAGPRGTAESAVVWRSGLRPGVRAAAAGEADFLRALQEHASLVDSLAAAPALDLLAWLAPAVQSGLLLGARRL